MLGVVTDIFSRVGRADADNFDETFDRAGGLVLSNCPKGTEALSAVFVQSAHTIDDPPGTSLTATLLA